MPSYSIRVCSFWIYIVIGFRAIAYADQDCCNQDIAAIRQRLARIEQLLQIGTAQNEVVPLLQHVSSYHIDDGTILAMKSLSIPVPVIKNNRQTLQPTSVLAIATSLGKLLLISEKGSRIAEVSLPTSCQSLRLAYDSGDDNLLAIGGCQTVHIASLTIWQDAVSRDLSASIIFELALSTPFTPITSIYVQNQRYLKQFTIGTGTADLLIYTRNGTLRYQERTESSSAIVGVAQQRSRHLTYSTSKEIGFIRYATSTHSTEICKIVDDRDEFVSFTHNPKQFSILYAGTQNGRLLVFDTNQNRQQRKHCVARSKLELDPGFALSISAVPDYVFAASSRSLFVLNATGDSSLNPRIISTSILNVTNSTASPLLSIRQFTDHIRVEIGERNGTYIRTFLVNIVVDQIHQQARTLPRTPIFLVIMIGTLIYQFGKKKVTGNRSDLSDDDKRMIDSIIQRSQFDSSENDPFGSRSKANSLRHRHHNSYKHNQGEIPSRPSESSCDEDEGDEGRHKKIN